MNLAININQQKKLLPYIVFAFVLILGAGLVLQNQKLLILSAAICIIPVFSFLVLFRLNVLALITVFVIPLSIKGEAGASAVSLPGEILVLVLAGFYLLYKLNRNESGSLRVWRHPLTWIIIIDLVWSVFTGVIGEMPLVSMKRLLIKSVFIIVFYFFFLELFLKKLNPVKLWYLYVFGLIIPILWTLFNHASHDFSKVVSFVMPLPFFNDHTLYAACIAFVLPILVLLAFRPDWFGFKKYWRFAFIIITVLMFFGEYFSYSRAAWLSVITAALSGLLITFLRFKTFHFILIVLAGLIAFGYYSRDLYMSVEKVDDVSRKENVEEHFRSVMNIQTDASNLERINRWQSALRMFKDRPVTGFGPGTNIFVYGRYQVTSEMTRISTNHGEKGNAHSEYLMYLSESGLPGLLIFLVMIYIGFSRAVYLFYKAEEKREKWLIFAVLLGFITFLVHGLFNSFIDTEKASFLFYTALASIVFFDLRFRKRKQELLMGFDPDPGKRTAL